MTKKPGGTKKPDSKPPADKRRPVYVTSRLRYFDGEFLKTRDFVDEQDYHVDRQTRHEARLHAPGILEGLGVWQTDDQKNSLSVTVDIGSAADAEGNQILVSRPTEVVLNPVAGDGDYIVDIKFDEAPTSVQPGSGGATRFTQRPGNMLAIGTSLRPGAVPLARVRVTDGVIDTIDTDYFSSSGPTQKYAGVKLPGPSGNDVTLRVENVADNPNGYYPDDNNCNPPDYKVLLSASGGLKLDGDGLWVPNTFVGSDGKVSIGKSYPDAPEDYLEVWDGPGDDAHRLLGVTDEVIHAYSNTVIGANGKVSIGKSYSFSELEALQGYLQVWSPSNDRPLLSVTDDALAVAGAATVSGRMSIGTTSVPTNPLEIYDGSGNPLLSVSNSDGLTVTGKATVSKTLTASGGIAISATQIDADGQVAIGKSSGAPSSPLEVYDGTGSPLLTVSASGVLAVTGMATVSGTLVANGGIAIGTTSAPANPLEIYDDAGSSLLSVSGSDGLLVAGMASVDGVLKALEYSFPASATPGDTSPVITARKVPAGQGNDDGIERSELILFAANDTTHEFGPDSITLRAPALRLQTYSASVGDIDNDAGCQDRIYVDPDGRVSMGKSYYPDNASNWLEVWDPSKAGSGDSALLEVHDDKINTSVPLNANAGLTVGSDGLTLNGASSLFGDYVPINLTLQYDDNAKAQTASYTAEAVSSDGFVIMLMSGKKDEDNWYGDLNIQTQAPGSGDWKNVAYCSVDWNINSGTNVRVPMQSTMTLVRKGYVWRVQANTNYSGNDGKDNHKVTIAGWWVPLGNS